MLHEFKDSLPDQVFQNQLMKLKALQQRIKAICDRLEVVEVFVDALFVACYMSNERQNAGVQTRVSKIHAHLS